MRDEGAAVTAQRPSALQRVGPARPPGSRPPAPPAPAAAQQPPGRSALRSSAAARGSQDTSNDRHFEGFLLRLKNLGEKKKSVEEHICHLVPRLRHTHIRKQGPCDCFIKKSDYENADRAQYRRHSSVS